MGKKSRRPNRNKPKDLPAAVSPAVAAPRQVITSPPVDDVAAQNPNQLQLTAATFNQLCASQDSEGMLELESELSAMENRIENLGGDFMRDAGSINFSLGLAHFEMGREGGIDEAWGYLTKAIELAKKAGNNQILSSAVLSLSRCYVKMRRVEEAMELHKTLCDEIGKESLDPDSILQFAEILTKNIGSGCSRALAILDHHLGAIESSWENEKQCRAYDMIAILYQGRNDFAKSNVYFERQLSIAKEANYVKAEASALHGLGQNYGSMGEYGNAMSYLEEALVMYQSERGDDSIGFTYAAMGDVLCARSTERPREGRNIDAPKICWVDGGRQCPNDTVLLVL